jgi:hypothetical protein
MSKFIKLKSASCGLDIVIQVEDIDRIDVLCGFIYISHNEIVTVVRISIEELCYLITNAEEV